MKKIFLLFLTFGTFLANAQNFSYDDSPIDTARGEKTDFELTSTSYFKNTGDDTTFRWVRTLSLPSGWTNTICDNNQCYGETVDSMEFSLAKGDSFKMKVNFYPNDNDGMACVSLKVYNMKNLSEHVTKGFCAQAGFVSTSKIDLKQKVRLFPNPAKDKLNVQFDGENAYSLTVFDIVGNRVYQGTNEGTTRTINISNWKKGVYIVNISNNGQSINKSFVKQD